MLLLFTHALPPNMLIDQVAASMPCATTHAAAREEGSKASVGDSAKQLIRLSCTDVCVASAASEMLLEMCSGLLGVLSMATTVCAQLEVLESKRVWTESPVLKHLQLLRADQMKPFTKDPAAPDWGMYPQMCLAVMQFIQAMCLRLRPHIKGIYHVG